MDKQIQCSLKMSRQVEEMSQETEEKKNQMEIRRWE